MLDERRSDEVGRRVLRFADGQPDRSEGRRGDVSQQRAEPFERVRLETIEERVHRRRARVPNITARSVSE
jgi:hypothetical protein